MSDLAVLEVACRSVANQICEGASWIMDNKFDIFVPFTAKINLSYYPSHFESHCELFYTHLASRRFAANLRGKSWIFPFKFQCADLTDFRTSHLADLQLRGHPNAANMAQLAYQLLP